VARGSGKRAPRGQRRANASQLKGNRSQSQCQAARAAAQTVQDSRASHPPPQRIGQQACVPVAAVAGAQGKPGAHGGAPGGPARQSSLELVRSTSCCTHSLGRRCPFWQAPLACLHCKQAASPRKLPVVKWHSIVQWYGGAQGHVAATRCDVRGARSVAGAERNGIVSCKDVNTPRYRCESTAGGLVISEKRRYTWRERCPCKMRSSPSTPWHRGIAQGAAETTRATPEAAALAP
jgi:hypothetical protein